MQLIDETTSIVLTPRDRALLVALFECRVMTLQHAADLHFDRHAAYAKKRVAKLKRAGLLKERPRRRSEASVLQLTRAAWQVLQQDGVLEQFPSVSESVFQKRARVSDFTLRHELAVMDIKTAFVRALRLSDRYDLGTFCTWPRLLEFTTCVRAFGIYASQEVVVKPDGMIRIHERIDSSQYEMCFYLEVDRSTESQETLVRKARAYLEHYRSGSFAIREGGNREDYRKYPFRLLIVCRSSERQFHTLKRLLENDPPIFTHAWITTLTEVCQNPLGSIWLRPVDLRDCTTSGNASLLELKKISLFEASE